MITYKQLSLADIFTDCQNKFDNDKYKFLSLLDETIDLDEIVPASFVSHFHAATGRPRRHLLYPLLKALLYSLFSLSQPYPSWLFSWNIPRNYGISVGLMFFRMLLNSPGLNRTSFWTYNPCLTGLLTWPNQSARRLMPKKQPCFCLTPLVLKHG